MSTHATLTVCVAAKRAEALDIASFELIATDGGPLPAFTAGAHIDVVVPGGWTRQYSLCNAPTEDHRYVIAVLRDPTSRGGSAALHDRVQVGDTLTIGVPRNHFELAAGARQHLLFAGGIGITPILCMAERLSEIDADFELHYCARSKARAAFVDRLVASPFADHVRFHFDDGPAAQRLDTGFQLTHRDPGTQLYACGPEGFIDAVLTSARTQGWAEDRLHREFFSRAFVASQGDAFEVLLARSGRVILVHTEQTVTQALSGIGVTVPTSCEQGVCGTCMTGVLEGIPDHRDVFLTAEEQATNRQFLPCCSRSKTPRLVLDL